MRQQNKTFFVLSAERTDRASAVSVVRHTSKVFLVTFVTLDKSNITYALRSFTCVQDDTAFWLFEAADGISLSNREAKRLSYDY